MRIPGPTEKVLSNKGSIHKSSPQLNIITGPSENILGSNSNIQMWSTSKG